jgi:hypothetical protein
MTWFAGKEKHSAFLANPQYVPESLLVFAAMTIIIIVKGFQLFSKGGGTNGTTTTEQIN